MTVTNPNNDYLNGPESENYLSGLVDALDTLAPFLTKKQQHALEADLQTAGIAFDEPKYLQAACETAISATLAEMFPESFVYEKETKPPKNVDCAFSHSGIKFNLEVKCPDYSMKHTIDGQNAFQAGAFGRIDDYASIVEKLQNEVFDSRNNPNADPHKPLIKQQHMDNKLKDFLLSASGKFAEDTDEAELNVLVVCCSDRMDVQKWFFYMYGLQGLFTPQSYYPPSEYNNVDVVVLTNTYHRHHGYKTKDKLLDHWDWRRSFNLIFSNPMRTLDKKSAIWKFVNLIPNFSRELEQFKVTNGLDEMRIVHFIVEELLGKGRYYFQPDI
ncbi:hypothetical protein DIT71_06195 [Marinobacter vulgaris]|uniref:Uncharacterized protein n=1 Tax=Marinobacter vulgaris TaxID=1928331 RepID=A0A2V3ZPC0_9GAMM|nr:hypothetical protein [Marinobacter vulgaris]PXX92763.1 hypothetical protein DIT71_06195 [Marinobacter vulgaris]TSJ71287.1 hypothetical protein FPC41_03270 [Marinobacter vulgaris]